MKNMFFECQTWSWSRENQQLATKEHVLLFQNYNLWNKNTTKSKYLKLTIFAKQLCKPLLQFWTLVPAAKNFRLLQLIYNLSVNYSHWPANQYCELQRSYLFISLLQILNEKSNLIYFIQSSQSKTNFPACIPFFGMSLQIDISTGRNGLDKFLGMDWFTTKRFLS